MLTSSFSRRAACRRLSSGRSCSSPYRPTQYTVRFLGTALIRLVLPWKDLLLALPRYLYARLERSGAPSFGESAGAFVPLRSRLERRAGLSLFMGACLKCIQNRGMLWVSFVVVIIPRRASSVKGGRSVSVCRHRRVALSDSEFVLHFAPRAHPARLVVAVAA